MSDFKQYIEICVHDHIPLNIDMLYDGDINKSLIKAVKNHDLENVDISNSHPCSVLHIAVELNNIEMTKLLLKCGIDVNVRDIYKMTPLHYAVINDNIEIAELLIMNDADIHAENINNDDIEYFARLLNGRTRELVDEMFWLRRYKHDSDKFVYAACEGKYYAAKYLISHGYDLNYTAQCSTDCNEYTALSIASQRGDFKMVKLLIESGADPNINGYEIYNALDRAIYSGNVEILQYLIEHGGVFDDKYCYHCGPPIIEAVWRGNIKMVEYIIKLGEDINAKSERGDTALHLAIYRDYEEIVKLLISHGANVNIKSDEGETPLHSAAYCYNIEIVKLLLENGADPNAQDNKGKRPKDIAKDKNNIKIVNMIEGNIFKINNPDQLTSDYLDSLDL